MKYLLPALCVLVLTLALGLVLFTSQAQTQGKQEICCPPPPPEQECKVSGRVLNEFGDPVDAALVTAMITTRPPRGRSPMARTNKDGNFLLEHVECGNNSIWAEKEDEGYTQAGNVMSDEFVKNIDVEVGKTLTGVEIKFSQKFPRLTGKITDAKNGKPIRGTYIVIRRLDDPDRFFRSGVSEDGKFSVLTPNVPFTLEVAGEKHKPWKHGHTGNPKEPKNPMSFAPGSKNNLEIELEPKP